MFNQSFFFSSFCAGVVTLWIMALCGDHKDRELRIHESLEELSTDLADYIAELSEASVKERGVFSIALSGGSLISLMGYGWFCFLLWFQWGCCYNFWWMNNRKLCEAPYNKTVDWGKWYIFWADERVVAKSHADSNYKLAKDNLLSKVCTNASLLLCLRWAPSLLDNVSFSFSGSQSCHYVFLLNAWITKWSTSYSNLRTMNEL